MRQLIAKYWIYAAFALAIVAGFVVAHLSYIALIVPSLPYMIVDVDKPSKDSPVGFEPVERTGKDPSQGKRIAVTCKIPETYTEYLHYPANWEKNIFNPASLRGQIVKWILYSALPVMIGLLTARLVIIHKKNKKERR